MSKIIAYDINRFVEAQVGSNLNANPGMFYPAQQSPETNNNTKDFVIYNYREIVTSDAWWMNKLYITYMIWSTDYDRGANARYEMLDLLKRYDLSADEINAYFKAQNIKDNRVLSTYLVGSEQSSEPTQEQARHGFPLQFVVEYVRNSGRSLVNNT